MSVFGWLSIVVTVLLGALIGFELGRMAEGARADWSFLLSSGVAAALVYGVAIARRGKRPARSGDA